MPLVTAEELKKKDLTQKQAAGLRGIKNILTVINEDDTSYLKDSLDKYIDAVDTVLNAKNKNNEDIQKAVTVLNGLQDFLKEGSEFNTNYNFLNHDAKKHFVEDEEYFKNSLMGLKDIVGIKIDLEEIEEIQQDKLRAANKKNIDPEAKLSRPVVEFEVTNIEGIKVSASVGKNFLDPGCKEYKLVDNMLEELNGAAQRLTANIEADIDQKNASGFEYEEKVKLRDKIEEFRSAVTTIREAGKEDGKVTPEQAEKALNTVKNMPEFLMGSFDKTNYRRLADMNVNTNTLNYGLDALEKGLKVGIDSGKIESALAKDNMTFKANGSIELLKKNISKNNNEYKTNPDLLKETITRIMATRMAVNSIPGKGKSLDVFTNSVERYKAEQKLLGNKQFRDFLATVVDDPKKIKAAISLATSGHGGGLDKMFTTYLKTRPAGELRNDPEISRFMPTVKDRLEYLQKKAGAANGRNQNAPVKEIAEIVALREIAGIKLNSKSMLKQQIPTNKNLADKVNKYAVNGKFNTVVETRAVRELITTGHGGLMLQEIKNQMKLSKQTDKIIAEEKQAALNKQGPVKGGPKLS